MLTAENTRLPNAIRLALDAHHRADDHGHALYGAGELARTLGIQPKDLSRALVSAKAKRLIDPRSSSRCVVVIR